ncbi:MAG: ribosome-associated translation inhibitor RaiA [Anaerolineae bacterium]|nr:ribosome-associated translation inhibitor RaiA [Anaerolineae bacterium]
MDVIIQAHNLKVNAAIEEYARRKVGKLDRYLPNIQDVRIDLAHENTRRGSNLVSAQITVRHKRGAILRAEEKSAGEINTAIDSAVDKMYRRIQRFKGKRSRKGRERFIATIEELDIAEDIPDVEEYVDEYVGEEVETTAEPETPVSLIDRRKVIELTPMTEHEAIEQMELLGHTFFVFFNMEASAVNILYRREHGGYGILIPSAP